MGIDFICCINSLFLGLGLVYSEVVILGSGIIEYMSAVTID